MAKGDFKDSCIAYGSGVLISLAVLYAPAALIGGAVGAAVYYLTHDDDDDDNTPAGCLF